MSNQLPPVDLEVQRKALELVREAARSGRLTSIHDVSDGGLGVAVAECCIAGGIGAEVELEWPGLAPMLWGEGPGGYVVSGPPEAVDELGATAGAVPVPRARAARGGSPGRGAGAPRGRGHGAGIRKPQAKRMSG